MNRKVNTLMAAGALSCCLLMGCSKSATQTTEAPVTPANPQGGAAGVKAQRGGGIADPNAYPAPAGVKTGVQPGGLK